MSFIFYCPSCRQKLDCDDAWDGLNTNCPKCAEKISVRKEKQFFKDLAEHRPTTGKYSKKAPAVDYFPNMPEPEKPTSTFWKEFLSFPKGGTFWANGHYLWCTPKQWLFIIIAASFPLWYPLALFFAAAFFPALFAAVSKRR